MPIATGIAAGAGIVLAILIGGVLAFLGKTQEDGLTNFDFANDQLNAATQNPLFADSTTVGSSQIYQS
mgnify:CR=1 FL=1